MKNRVLASLETPDGDRCVDLFRRPDGSFGFEIYRRDTEDLTGWFAIGGHVHKPYATQDQARQAAARLAPWLDT
ncbi:MAG: hypothetical protein HQ483_15195 [Rhodospirillales bacterium]|nr:hypothetical protein [Rhodospirillales bacterium]